MADFSCCIRASSIASRTTRRPGKREPLEGLARDGQLAAYIHEGFWHPMDTLRDKQYLEHLWADGSAPWKIWK